MLGRPLTTIGGLNPRAVFTDQAPQNTTPSIVNINTFAATAHVSKINIPNLVPLSPRDRQSLMLNPNNFDVGRLHSCLVAVETSI
jgi:hypothetical protein